MRLPLPPNSRRAPHSIAVLALIAGLALIVLLELPGLNAAAGPSIHADLSKHEPAASGAIYLPVALNSSDLNGTPAPTATPTVTPTSTGTPGPTLTPSPSPTASPTSPSGSQVRLGHASGDDWEPSIAADAFGHVYVLWPHYGGVPGCTACPSPTALLQISGDRGQTWSSPIVVTPNQLGTAQVDTQIVVDPLDGKSLYASWLQNDKSDVVVLKSTDFGQTWSTPVVADSAHAGTDKPILLVRGQDLYVGYDTAHQVWISTSHDGGSTWSSHSQAEAGKLSFSLAAGGAVDSHGVVFFSRAGYPPTAPGPVTLFVTRSTNAGVSWSNVTLDTSAAPPTCAQYNCGWEFLGAQLVMTGDVSDTLYALWNAGGVDTGPERIYFSRSIDGGATWSARQDVSLAAAGVEHAFPAITSRGPGNVRIAWMDTRNAGAWNLYYRTSEDGGASWSAESQLSNFVPGYPYISSNGYAFPFGDYFELDVDDQSTTHAVWGEGPNWTGPGNIWYARVRH